MTHSKIEKLVYQMMTENTGTHMLDSGGAYGRNWQRNQAKTIDDFNNAPSATLEIWTRDGKATEADFIPTVSTFHHLVDSFELDDLCDTFNALPVDDWDGDQYGVSRAGSDWLSDHGFEAKGDGWNTYNWQSNFSQILQGTDFERDGEQYVLIQVHGGCDARGGYTDAKLFKAVGYDEYYPDDRCGFSVELPDVDTVTTDMFTGRTHNGFMNLDWSGEWIGPSGSCATDDDFVKFALAAGVRADNPTVFVQGDHWTYS